MFSTQRITEEGQRVIDELNAAPPSALWGVAAFLLLLILIALIRGARLKRRVNQLSASVDSLLTENAARYTRHVLHRPIPGDDDQPPEARGLRARDGSRQQPP